MGGLGEEEVDHGVELELVERLGAAGAALAQQKVVWKASDVHPLGYPTVEAIVRMGKKLETATKGRISIQMFPSMQLGGEKEMAEGMRLGSVCGAPVNVSVMSIWVPEGQLFDMPFLFRDEAQAHKVLDGKVGQLLAKKLEAKEIKAEQDIQAGTWPRDDNPLVHAPHTAAAVSASAVFSNTA